MIHSNFGQSVKLAFVCFLMVKSFASTLVPAGYVVILKILFSCIIVEEQSIIWCITVNLLKLRV